MIQVINNIFRNKKETNAKNASKGCEVLAKTERAYIRRLSQVIDEQPDESGLTPKEAVIRITSDQLDKPDAYTNVKLVLCALDNATSEDLTVANCVFEKGGIGPAHRHHNKEHVFVADGAITETVSGKTFLSDESFTIHPYRLHGFTSDHALLVVTWRPELHTVETGEVNQDLERCSTKLCGEHKPQFLLDKRPQAV